jgi:hypothetical protein
MGGGASPTNWAAAGCALTIANRHVNTRIHAHAWRRKGSMEPVRAPQTAVLRLCPEAVMAEVFHRKRGKFKPDDGLDGF